jgi:integrase
MPKKPKTPAGEPKIKVCHGRLQIVLTYRTVRKYLSLGLPDSKSNKVYAEMVKSRIMSDLLNDNFDPTLDKYRREAVKPDERKPDDISIEQLWEQYTNYKRHHLAPSTITKDFNRVAVLIARFPVSTLDGAVVVRDYLNSTTTPNTTKRVLTQLNACCTWAVKSKLIAVNPFLGMAADIKLPKGRGEDTDINPFSPDERDRIIGALKTLNIEYAALVEFMFRTGCRPSEAVALQWRHIGIDFKTIAFEQAVTTSENGLAVKQGLKTQERRVFPCGDKLSLFLHSIAPKQIDRQQFIFKPSNSAKEFIDFQNFANRVWHPCLKALEIESRKPYQMRHTYITFCLDSGMDAKDVAKLVGNSPEMIYRHYAGAKRDLIAPDL